MANLNFKDTPSVPTTISDAPRLAVVAPATAAAAPGPRQWLSPDHPWRLVCAVAVPFWVALATLRIVSFELTMMAGNGIALMPWTVRVGQNVLVMLLALFCYRVALQIGWPAQGRVRAAALQLLLAMLVALSARPILLTLGIPAVPTVTVVPEVPPMTAWMWVEWLIMNLTQGFGLRLWFTSSLDFLVSYFFGLALLLGVRATLALRDAELERAELQNAWMQSRLQVLRMQLNPHFLFNALNTVATMLERRPGEARALVVSLGHLLRRTLDSADREWNSLAEEVDFAERYLAIQAARFDGRLSYRFEIGPALEHARVPAMILQPLVENAVLHGVGDDRDRLRVWVAAQRSGSDLEVVIGNETTGVLDPVSTTEGVGLGNTRSRLAVCFGGRASLQLSRPSPASCVARLRLPLDPESLR